MPCPHTARLRRLPLVMGLLTMTLVLLMGTPGSWGASSPSSGTSSRTIREEIRALKDRFTVETREERGKFHANWKSQDDQIRNRQRQETKEIRARYADQMKSDQGTAAHQQMKRELADLRDRHDGERRSFREKRRQALDQLENALFQKRRAHRQELAQLQERYYQAKKEERDAKRRQREENSGKKL